jgi:hypothetical protein
MKWYNVELTQNESNLFKAFLMRNKIKFESSGCYNLVHFEVYASKEQANMLNTFLETIF